MITTRTVLDLSTGETSTVDMTSAEVAALPAIPPPPGVDQISYRQFAMEARDRGFLTQAEAVAFVSSGTIPSFLAAIISALPTQQERDDAELLIAGATVFERYHPLTIVVGEAMRGNTPLNEFLNDFFGAAGIR